MVYGNYPTLFLSVHVHNIYGMCGTIVPLFITVSYSIVLYYVTINSTDIIDR